MPSSKEPVLTPYQIKEIETASPEQLLLILYDGAIRFLNHAKQGFAEDDFEVYNNLLIRTQRIIRELMATLDMTIAPEVAENLYRLYDYLHYRLVQANIKRDVEMVDEVLGHLRDLRQTWAQAIQIAKQENQPVNTQQAFSSQYAQSPTSSSDAMPQEGSSRSYSV